VIYRYLNLTLRFYERRRNDGRLLQTKASIVAL